MVDDPALEAHEQHEQAQEAAEKRDPFLSQVSITVALLAVLAAVAGSLETVEGGRAITASSEAVLAQDEATDAWNEYQADSLKRHIYDIAADQGGTHADTYRKTANEQRDKRDAIRTRAIDDEKERTRLVRESAAHETRHHWLTGSATLLEIGIAMSTVTIITRRRPLWASALLFAIAGVSLFAVAYLT